MDKTNYKITCYNIFIKDSFNIIYNRPSLDFIPKSIKNIIVKYRNKNACYVVVKLAKIWSNNDNKNIVLKYKSLAIKYKYFTNNIYKDIIINKIKILNKVYLFSNSILSIMYILCFYKFITFCLKDTNILPTPTIIQDNNKYD